MLPPGDVAILLNLTDAVGVLNLVASLSSPTRRKADHAALLALIHEAATDVLGRLRQAAPIASTHERPVQ